ncbi:MAG: hypothetical protein ACQESV_07875 [Thermodesulfobacteriota bacterium]
MRTWIGWIAVGVTVCALSACQTMSGAGKSPQDVSVDYYDQLDADGNGKVSLEEFMTAFPEASVLDFRRMDTNGDGAVEKDEWEAAKAE